MSNAVCDTIKNTIMDATCTVGNALPPSVALLIGVPLGVVCMWIGNAMRFVVRVVRE